MFQYNLDATCKSSVCLQVLVDMASVLGDPVGSLAIRGAFGGMWRRIRPAGTVLPPELQ